jgi:hypothetical protein
MEWPDSFPPDCPPNDAKGPCDRVYRLIQQDSATADDFLTVRQLYPNRQFPDSEKECRVVAKARGQKPGFLINFSLPNPGLFRETGLMSVSPISGDRYCADNFFIWLRASW